MTVARGMFVIVLMVALGVCIVLLREESAKAANRIQMLHREEIGIQHRMWKLEMELARLRTPEEIRRRAQQLGLNVMPPSARPGPNAESAVGRD